MAKNRILIAEDDSNIAESIALNLDLSGYDYHIIDDGLAVDRHRKAAADVVAAVDAARQHVADGGEAVFAMPMNFSHSSLPSLDFYMSWQR